MYFTPVRKEIIYNISALIKQLKAKKKEWQRHHLKIAVAGVEFSPNVGERYSHLSVSGTTDKITVEFEHLIRHVRKMCIKLCSEYISLLNKANKTIIKNKQKRKLNEIYSAMLDLYNSFLLSDWKKDLRKEHKIEFKEALELKRLRQELAKKVSDWDITWLRSEGLIEPSQESDPNFINWYKKFGSSLVTWKNWRENSLVKNELKRQLYFQNFIKDTITRYKEMIDNLSS